jgi:hypothetical protein
MENKTLIQFAENSFNQEIAQATASSKVNVITV